MAGPSQSEVDQAVQSMQQIAGTLIAADKAADLYRLVGDLNTCLDMVFNDTARYHLNKHAASGSSAAQQPTQPVLASGRTKQGPFQVLHCSFPQQQGPIIPDGEPLQYTVRRQLQCKLGGLQKLPDAVTYGIIRQREGKPEYLVSVHIEASTAAAAGLSSQASHEPRPEQCSIFEHPACKVTPVCLLLYLSHSYCPGQPSQALQVLDVLCRQQSSSCSSEGSAFASHQ